MSARAAIPKMLSALGLISLVAAAILLGSGRTEATAVSWQDDATIDLYAQNCAPCHGGIGEGGVGPSLQRSTEPLADQVATITFGRGGMPAFGATLSRDQLEAISAFSAGLQTEPSVPPEDDLAPLGRQLYAQHCAFCHGDDGEGGIGPNLRDTVLPPAGLRAAIRDGQGTMRGFGGTLSADELAAVEAFVEEVVHQGRSAASQPNASRVAEGARLFTNNCSQCHGPDASGGEGPALKRSTLSDAEMVSVISNGYGAMSGFSAILSADTIDAIVTYVDATRAAAGTEFSGAGPTVLGRDTYISTCATCHALDGSGGLGPSLTHTGLTTNEVVSQVFGGHPGDMPAFEGVLDPVQVREVAQYVLSLEGAPTSEFPWTVYLVVAVVVIAIAVGLWYRGVLDLLWHRIRRRSASGDPG